MQAVLRRRWPILAAACLALGAAALPPAGAADEPDKDEMTNGIGMKLKLIKAGKFLMGSPKDDKDAAASEKPQHEVEITRPFYLGVYPVTRGQFAAFVKDDGYKTDAEKAGEKNTWRNPGFEKYDPTDDDPVVFVSWKDAAAFCEWLSKKEKKTYVLPTEAEWEYACRAGTKTAFFWGDDPKGVGDFVWRDGKPHPVGGKKPNAWGLYDLVGFGQWCADFLNWDEYKEGSVKDPKGPGKGNYRVLRGVHTPDLICDRSAYRDLFMVGNRGGFFTFRVALRPAEKAP